MARTRENKIGGGRKPKSKAPPPLRRPVASDAHRVKKSKFSSHSHPSHNRKPTTQEPTTQEPTSLSLSSPSQNAAQTPDLSTHDLTTLKIQSSSKISKKVTQALEILSVYPVPEGENPRVVCFVGKAGVGSKVVSVVEIAKREVGKGGVGKWFQYTGVEGVVEEVKKDEKEKHEKGKHGKKDGNERSGVEEEEVGEGAGDGREEGEESGEEMAFETMKTPWERANEGKAQVRAVPVLRIYLARVRIESLKRAYGEQTNALQTA